MTSNFVFYGGKGGVGKTTCAAARAIAETRRGRRVLVVSTDPAHSLGDVLGRKLSARPVRVGGAGTAIELDAARAFARWLTAHRRALGDILEQGTWLDRDDVEALLDLSIPGLDELAGLLEIIRLSDTGRADTIVVDTAPTGHTLRLFAAPQTVAAVADAFDALHAQHRLIRDQLARVGRPEASDRLIAFMSEQARTIAARLRDPRTMIVWVTLAEELAVRETSDALTTLEGTGVRVDEIVVNRVQPKGPPCPVCDRRRGLERQAIARIRRGVGKRRRVRILAEEEDEPRGVKALAPIGKALIDRLGVDPRVDLGRIGSSYDKLRMSGARQSLVMSVSTSFRASRRGGPPAPWRKPNGRPLTDDAFDSIADAKLLFFGGKGGVGKTTVAAAAALRLSAAHPDSRVLLISTDPAHSLGDVFDVSAADTPTSVPGAPPNLRLREVDAPHALAMRRATLESALDEFGAAVAAGGDRTRVSELLDIAPPGVDELFGLLSVVAARDEFDRIVVDTAPTGHALRLLEMPEIVAEWTQVLMRMLLKYRSIVAPGTFAAELVDLSRSIRALRQSLARAGETHFVVVTRIADVPAAETARLLGRLRRMRLAVPAIVANAMTLAPARCPRCRRVAAGEQRRFDALRRLAARNSRSDLRPASAKASAGTVRLNQREGWCAIIQTPLTAPPPRGVPALEQWNRQWLMADG